MKPKTSLSSFFAISGSALLAVSSVNATQFWDGTAGGGDNNWNTAANWGGDTLPAFTTTAINFGSINATGDNFGNVVVPTVTTTNNNLTAGTLIKSINFGNTGVANRTDAYTLQGNSIVLGDVINNGIVTTALSGSAIVSSIEDVIALNMDLGTAGTHRAIQTGAKHDLRIDGVISGGVNVGVLFRSSDSKITLTNTNNSYLGFTNVAEGTASTVGGVLEIASIANGGSNSSIGASSNAAANLRFNSGFNDTTLVTLRYIGATDASTDRLFSLFGNISGTNSMIESSGDGTLSFTNTGAIVTSHQRARNFYLGGTNTGNNTFALSLSDFTEVSTFTKRGVGKWILTGNHTYTGATTIEEGMLQFAKQVSLYNNNTAGTGWTAANIKVASGATLALNVGGTGEFTTGNVTTLLTNLGGTNGTSTTGFAGGSRIGFDTTNAAGGTFTIEDNMIDSTGGSIGLTKLGTGTLILSGTNNNTGETIVSAGTLLVNGSTSASSVVTVASGATLGGSGTVGGATTISGNLNPGNSPGLLSFGSTLTLNTTAITTMEINGTAIRGTDYDAVTATGSFTYGGSLVLDFGVALGEGTHNFNLFDFGSQTGTFSSVSLTGEYTGSLVNNSGIWSLTSGLNSWTFTQSTGDLQMVVSPVVIPEPKAALLGAIGVLLLFRRRR